MEEQITNPAPQTPPAPAQKKDPFSTIGKIAVALVVVILLLGGGIVLGKNLNKSNLATGETTQDSGVPPTETTSQSQTSPSPEPARTDLIKFKGGLGNDSTSFKPYFLHASKDWLPTNDINEITDRLTLTRGAYAISIYQAPMGGNACVYPPEKSGDFQQLYTEYEEFTGKNNEVYRRSSDPTVEPTITYTICQKGAEDTFQVHTIYGNVTVKAPNPADKKVLAEIDSIIATLEEQ